MSEKSKTFVAKKKAKPVLLFFSFFQINCYQSKIFQYTSFLLAEFQYISILLWTAHMTVKANENSSFTKFIHSVSQSLAFGDLFDQRFQNSFFETLLIIVWAYTTFYCFILIYLGVKACKDQTIKQATKDFLIVLFQFHFSFIFWMVNMILTIYMFIQFYKIKVFSINTNNSKLLIVNIIVLLLNYIFALMTTLFCFDPFRSKNLFATQSSLYQSLTFLLKALIAPLIIFSPPDNNLSSAFCITLSFLISISRLIYLLRNFPFYYYRPTRTATLFSATASWISCINLLALILSKAAPLFAQSIMCLYFLPLFVVLPGSLKYFNYVIESYMQAELSNLTTRRQVFLKLFVYQLFTDRVKLALNDIKPLKRTEIYFMSDLPSHARMCENPQCLCTLFMNNRSEKIESDFCDKRGALSAYFLQMNKNCLLEAIKRIKENDDMKLFMTYLVSLEPKSSASSALNYLLSTSSETLGFFQSLKMFFLQQKIQTIITEFFQERPKGRLDMIEFVSFYSATNEFFSLMTQVAKSYITFWETYKKPNLNMVNVIEESMKIEQIAEKIDGLWRICTEKYDYFTYRMNLYYRLYLILVRNTPYAAQEVGKRAQLRKNIRNNSSKYLEEVTKYDLFSSQLISIYVSMTKEKIGRILYISDNVQSHLGLQSRDIIGKNLNTLLPPTFAEKHDQVLLKHLEQFKSSKTQDYYTRKGYLRTSTDSIVPCITHVSMFPYIQKELVYIAAVKIVKSKLDYIIFNESGYVDAFTKGIGYILNLNCEGKTHIDNLCKNISKLNLHFEHDVFRKKEKIVQLLTTYRPQRNSIINRNKLLAYSKLEAREDNQGDQVAIYYVRQNDNRDPFKLSTNIIREQILGTTVYIFEIDSDSYLPEEKANTRYVDTEVLFGESDTSVTEASIFDVPSEVQISKRTSKFFRERPSFRESFLHPGLRNDFVMQRKIPLLGIDTLAKRIQERRSSINSGFIKIDSIPQRRNTQHSPLEETLFTQRGLTQHSQRDHLIKDYTQRNSTINNELDSRRELVPRPNKVDTRFIQSPMLSRESPQTPSMRSSEKSHSSKLYPKLERAIYSAPINKRERLMTYLPCLYLVMCCVLLLISLFKTQQNLKFVKANTSIMTTSNMRLFSITALNKGVRLLSLYNANLIADDRYGVYNLPLEATLSATMLQIQKHLNEQNVLVRVALDNIEQSLQKRFYDNQIPVIIPDGNNSVGYINSLDFATTLIVSSQKLVSNYGSNKVQTQYYMDFILNNTMNDILVQSELIAPIVIEDINFKLDFLKNLSLGFTIICSFATLGLLLMTCYYRHCRDKTRDRLIEILLCLNDNDIEENLNHVRIFINETLVNQKHIKNSEALLRTSTLRQNTNNMIISRSKRHSVDMRGLNANHLRRMLFSVILYIVVLIPFIFKNITFDMKNDMIKSEITAMSRIDGNIADLNLLTTAIYEYIQYNKTTEVMNRPIDVEWEATYLRASRTQSFFASLINNNNKDFKGTKNELDMLLTDNLCEIVPALNQYCGVLRQGIVDRGIIGLNSYILSVLRYAKNAFDVSDKSYASAKTILSSDELIMQETIYIVAQFPIYRLFTENIQLRVEALIQGMIDSSNIPVIAAIIIDFLIGILILTRMQKMLDAESAKWRQLLRKIPFNIVISNKMLKTYLINENTRMLNPLKSQF